MPFTSHMPFLLPRTQTLHPNLPRLLTKKKIETAGSIEEIQSIYYSFNYAFSADPDAFVSRSLPSAKSHLHTHLNSKMYKTKRKYYEHNKLEILVPGSWDLRIVHSHQDMAVDPRFQLPLRNLQWVVQVEAQGSPWA